eukprot:6185208-Pleurochrysis_carterae.AAC.1
MKRLILVPRIWEATDAGDKDCLISSERAVNELAPLWRKHDDDQKDAHCLIGACHYYSDAEEVVVVALRGGRPPTPPGRQVHCAEHLGLFRNNGWLQSLAGGTFDVFGVVAIAPTYPSFHWNRDERERV